MAHPNPLPVMVTGVPPPVPPRAGLTPATSAVRRLSYVYAAARVCSALSPVACYKHSFSLIISTGEGWYLGLVLFNFLFFIF